jgi:adenine-specific DNA-methyltransferase
MAAKKSPVKKTAPRKKKVEGGPISIDALKHDDKRVNIPTADLAARLSERVDVPPLLYPRDPSLDPQLVWKGKDVQDASDLSVPVVPIYIQEKIDPRIIVENLRETAKSPETEPELTLFDDFDGFEGTQMLEFYEHEGNWSNRLILGDSLLVMSSLAEKESLRGKVQVVYFDPPYGIKFGSNWQVSTRKIAVSDGNVADITRQPEQVKAFRDTWVLGIHSYLTYLRERIIVARDLLTETGSLFLQIGDENVHLVRALLDEIFGSENFISEILIRKTTGATAEFLGTTTDYVLWYGKNRKLTKYRQLFTPRSKDSNDRYGRVLLPDGTERTATVEEKDNPSSLPVGAKLFQLDNITSPGSPPVGGFEKFVFRDREYRPGNGHFKTNEIGMKRLAIAGRLQTTGRDGLTYRRFSTDFGWVPINNLWTDISGAVMSRSDPKIYVVQSSVSLIERCILMASDPGDLVVDPTCGSGTTAYASEKWARRWITCDTSRVALALARTRLMTSKYPYFYLADSADGSNLESSISGASQSGSDFSSNVKRGFVYERVPHIKLGSIARNDAIQEGMTSSAIQALIDNSADKEFLFDRPLEDASRIRVSGRFTVESLSPHRSLMPELPGSTDDFTSRILGHLTRAGVQNTFKNERLQFDRLDSYPGTWINGEGEYSDADGISKRVAVVIGPEHGTVSADIIREAAIEATDGRGFDVLIVCGLAFDPLVGEQAKKFGRLVVLPTKINPDLTMPDGLLKNTGSGNLFTVFGEPDISISRTVDMKVVVKVNGVDVYDPTTGVVRSGTVNDIACWFIDSNYDQKSFFVRHAYFTGGNEPYEALAKTLRTEIDLEAWSALYSNESQPFNVPTTGRIAVKVINHFGDEVMQIYDVK